MRERNQENPGVKEDKGLAKDIVETFKVSKQVEREPAEYIDELIKQAKLFYCNECGTCVSICPMLEMYQKFFPEFSPRYIIEEALINSSNILESERIWFCLSCTVCTSGCPQGVRYVDFIHGLRELAIAKGYTKYSLFCKRCGRYYLPMPTLEYSQGIMDEKGLSTQFLDLCPECKRQVYARGMTNLKWWQ